MMPPPSQNAPKTSPQISEDVDSGTKTENDQERQDGTSSSSSGGGLGYDEPCCLNKGNGVDQVVAVDMTLEADMGVEKVCRICHLRNEQSSGSTELIQLGCNCREELGISHRHCAEAWFKQRGNRLCEICNKTAKNVRLIKDTRLLIMEYDDIRPVAMASSRTSFDSPSEGSRRCKQSCNFILACLVLAFLISTFLRVKLF